MKKLFNGRNARRSQEAIMNNAQTPLVSSEGQFAEAISSYTTAEYKQREDGCYEYKTKMNYNDGEGTMHKWTFSPEHQLIERADYICTNGQEYPTEKTTYNKNGRTTDKVNEVTTYQSWEDDDGETQIDYGVINAESVTKTHSYPTGLFTKRTEELSYMKPECPCPDGEINILNSGLTVTDVRYGYTDGRVVVGINPYTKKAYSNIVDKSLIGVIRVENKTQCINGTTTTNVNLKTPLITFRSTENHSSIDPNFRNDVNAYTVMNPIFNKPSYEIRKAMNSEFPESDIVTVTVHDYVYKNTIYGKALIDHEKRISDISDKLTNLPAVEGMKTRDWYPTTGREKAVHNQGLFEDLNNIEKSVGRSNDSFHVTIEGGQYDGSTFNFVTSTCPSDKDAGKYLWCQQIQLKVKEDEGDSTTFYRYGREREDAMASKKVVEINRYTDFIESIVAIINTTPAEIPDMKIIYNVKTSENGNKEITRQTLYRYYDSTDNANS